MKKLSNLFICILFVLSLTGCADLFNNILYGETTSDPKKEKEVESILGKVKWEYNYNGVNQSFQITDIDKNLIDFTYNGVLTHGEYTARHDGVLVFRADGLKYNLNLKKLIKNDKTLTFELGTYEDYSTINWIGISATTDGKVPPEPTPEPEKKPGEQTENPAPNQDQHSSESETSPSVQETGNPEAGSSAPLNP